MAIEICVYEDQEKIATWWVNYISSLNFDSFKENMSVIECITEDLKKYNCKNVPNSTFVYFDTIEDFLAFKLRWL